MPAMSAITVIKRNPAGEETWRYQGVLTSREGNAIHLEAPFNAKDTPFMGIIIKNGDLFIETYYIDRWYNIFQIHDRDDGTLKGWYCNIGKPAVYESDEVISYIDLALDLWIDPGGKQTVMDRDEFQALELDEDTRAQALTALRELQALFSKIAKQPREKKTRG